MSRSVSAASARTRSTGHWDTAGQPPYLRWGLAGAVDYHAENFGSFTRVGQNVEEGEVPALLLDAHARMMAERPPAEHGDIPDAALHANARALRRRAAVLGDDRHLASAVIDLVELERYERYSPGARDDAVDRDCLVLVTPGIVLDLSDARVQRAAGEHQDKGERSDQSSQRSVHFNPRKQKCRAESA